MRSLTRSLTRSLAGRSNALKEFLLGSTYADAPGTACTIPIPAAATAAGIETAMHPSVVYFPNGKTGYKYWMAHSPFDSGIQEHEDPNIVASNDGVTWVVPEGLTNPIEPKATLGYHNDPFLYWDAVDQLFICIWGAVADISGQATTWHSYGRTSSDGIHWSARFLVATGDTQEATLGSCAFSRKSDGSWLFWGVHWLVDINNAVIPPVYVKFMTAPAGAFNTREWSETSNCTFDNTITRPFHMDVRRYGAGYVMLLCEKDIHGRHQLLFLTSNDGAAWSVDRQFPYAIGWNGDSTFGSNYYKAGFVLGPWFGTGNIGRMWYTNDGFDWIKVTDISAIPASQLADNYAVSTIDAILAAGGSPTLTIADKFTHADGALTGKTAPHGGTWQSYIFGATVAAGKVSKIGANGYGNGYLVYGAMDGVVGMRLSTFPAAAEVSLVCRAKRAGTGSNSYAIVLNYAGSLWRLQYYVGGSWVYLATWAPAALDDGSYDGTEIVMEFRGLAIRAWMDGRLMASCVIPQAAYDTLAAAPNAQVGFSVTDSATRIDRFFAHA